VCAALGKLAGVAGVQYLQEQDVFVVQHDPGQVSLEDIFTAVARAGAKSGQEYFSKLLA
jgi:copper chaperone CopZ